MDQFLTFAQIAEMFGGRGGGGRSKQWVRRHFLGSVPHYRLPGSGILFKKEDVEAWIEHHRCETVHADVVFAKLMGPRAVRKGGK